MISKKLTEMSIPELQKMEKIVKALIYMLLVMAVLLVILWLFLPGKKGNNPMIIVPATFIPIAILNISSLKNIKKEIAARDSQ